VSEGRGRHGYSVSSTINLQLSLISGNLLLVLNEAIETASPLKIQQAVNQLHFLQAQEILNEANDLAARRSGARGWDARGEQLKAEEGYRVSQEK
jgi:hypothetical protein